MSLPKNDKLVTTSNPDKDLIKDIDQVVEKVPIDTSEKVETENKTVDQIDLENAEGNNEYVEQNENEVLVAGLFTPKIKIPKPIKEDTFKNKNPNDLSNKDLQKQYEEQQLTDPEGKDFVIEQGTGKVVFGEFTDEQVKSFNDLLEKFQIGEIKKADSKSLNKIFKSIDKDVDGLLSETSFVDIVKTTFAKEFDAMKGGKMDIQEILTQASNLNRSDVYFKIIKTEPGKLDIPVLVRGLMESKLLYMKLRKVGNDILKSGTSTVDQRIEFYQTLRLWQTLTARAAGDVSISAKKLRVTQGLDKPTEGAVEDILKVLDEEMGLNPRDEKTFNTHLSTFMQLNPQQAGKFVEDSMGKKIRDAWAELWVNSLLSNPLTHVVNVSANFGFKTLKVAEYAIAATYNKIPGLGGPDGVMFNEIFDMVAGVKLGTRLAIENSYKALKTGEASTTKLDLRKPNAFGKRLLPEKYRDGFMGNTLEAMGAFYFTAPGRLLVAEDEFAKGIINKMELNRVARQRANEYLQLNPGDVEGAERVFLKTISNPDNEVKEIVRNAMLEGTFQKDLPPGAFNKMQQIFNIPEIKLFVPFYKTIMNIFFESNKRNPLMMAPGYILPGDLGGKIRADLNGKNGKRVQQLALAKLTTGASLMYTFGTMAYGGSGGDQDVMITGMAPMNKAERDAFFRKGFMPYSIAVLDKKTGKYVSTSYARFDPISSLLAISADMAYMASRPDQYADPNFTNTMTSIFSNGLMAIYPYLTQQPFLTGIQEFGRLFQPGYGDVDGAVTRTLSVMAEKLTTGTVGLVTGVGPAGKFNEYLTKLSDRTIYDTMFTSEQRDFYERFFGDEDIPLYIRTFYKSYNKAMKASPFFNPDLKPRLNLWGEILEGPETGVLSPIRVMDEKFNKVDDELLKLGLGLQMPRAFIGGIPMSQDEYYDYIKLLNKDRDGSGKSDLLEQLERTIDPVSNPNYSKLLPGEKIDLLRGVLQEYNQIAREEFLLENKGFNDKVNKLKEKIDKQGKK